MATHNARPNRKETQMKKDNVKLGSVYAAKVSGEVVPVRLDKVNAHGGWDGTNMRTKKQVRIKSAQRLRGLWPKKTLPIVADSGHGTADVGPVGETAARAAKDATQAAGSDTGQRGAKKAKAPKEPKPQRHSLLNLAAKVLTEAGTALACKEMVEKVLATGLWTTKGKTPAATLYSAILREITTKGDASRFRKTERGKFEIVTK
jgi:hypothetical protein